MNRRGRRTASIPRGQRERCHASVGLCDDPGILGSHAAPIRDYHRPTVQEAEEPLTVKEMGYPERLDRILGKGTAQRARPP
jgi:hypothetical protein